MEAKDNSRLPARGGEFVHTFTKQSEGGGAGIVAVPFMLIALLFFVLLAVFMLAAGGVSLLMGKPAKFDFRHSLNKSRGIFGGKSFANQPGGDDNVIDVEATEISEKEIDRR